MIKPNCFMERLIIIFLLFLQGHTATAQTKNFIDQPYIEVAGSADTSVTPDEIFIRIIISERETKDRASVEELEAKMVAALKSLGINTEKELTINDMASNFRSYLFKGKEVLKVKQYLLKVTNAATVGNVFVQLENLNISNASIDHVDHSGLENIRNIMRTKAVENAKTRALALTKPLNQLVGAAINIIDDESNTAGGMLRGRAAGVVVTGYASRGQAEVPDIDFEKIKVATNVNVKFVLK
jgi:uncharacterized protein YggE